MILDDYYTIHTIEQSCLYKSYKTYHNELSTNEWYLHNSSNLFHDKDHTFINCKK